MPTLYRYLCSGDLRSPRVTERRNSPLGIRDDDDDDDDDDEECEIVSKIEGKTNFSRRLRLSGTGIVECLEIIDVGCNLKQFDGLTRLTLAPRFYDRSTSLVTITITGINCN